MSDAQAGPPPLLDPLPHILCNGSLNLIAGASGIGKTALLAWLMRQFRDGALIFGHATNPPPAIGYLTADRPWADTKHWFEAVGFGDIRHYSIVDDPSLKLPNQRHKHLRVEFFKQCVAKLNLPPGSLLIVDPIALFLGGNLLDYDTVAFACIEIHRWLQESGQRFCVIGICHAAKQRADKNDRYLRLQDRISGSGALLGYTGTQMYLAAPEETGDKKGMYTFLWNPHRAKAEVFQFGKGDEGLFLVETAQQLTDEGKRLVLALSPAHRSLLATFPPYPETLATHTLIASFADAGAAKRRRLFEMLKELDALGYVGQAKHGVWGRTEKALDPDPLGESPA